MGNHNFFFLQKLIDALYIHAMSHRKLLQLNSIAAALLSFIIFKQIDLYIFCEKQSFKH